LFGCGFHGYWVKSVNLHRFRRVSENTVWEKP